MALDFNFDPSLADWSKSSGDFTDIGGAQRSRSEIARERWNKGSNADRQKTRKALEKRGEWQGGKYAQKSQERGGYPGGKR